MARSLDQLASGDQLPLVPLADTVRSLFPQRIVDAQDAVFVGHGRPLALDGRRPAVVGRGGVGDVVVQVEQGATVGGRYRIRAVFLH